MQDEFTIDLRQYIRVLFKAWYWILGLGIIAAAAAYLTGAAPKPVYEATSMVMAVSSQYDINFDPRIQTAQNAQPKTAVYADLSMGRDLLSEVFDAWQNKPAEISSPDDLRSALKLSQGSDPSILKFTAQLSEPAQAAALANLWVEKFITKANALFLMGEQVSFFQDQVAQSQAELQKAEQALADYQGKNAARLRQNQLNSVLQTQSELMARQRNIAYISQDIEALKQQLGTLPADSKADPADQLNILMIQSRAFNSLAASVAAPDSSGTTGLDGSQVSSPYQPQTSGGAAPQLQMQMPETSARLATVADQTAYLDRLAATLQAQSKSLQTQIDNLTPQVLGLQQQVQQAQSEADRLMRARDVAKETYTTLTRKLDEARISNNNPSGLKVVDRASEPKQQVPVTSDRMRNTVVAGMAGALLAAMGALAVSWWRSA